jgi:hypothetical protein
MKLRPARARRILFAFVGLAVLIDAGPVVLRWREYHRRMRQERWQSEQYLLTCRRFEGEVARLRGELASVGAPDRAAALRREIGGAEYQVEGFRQLAEWSGQKARKYREATRRPWLVAPPDPRFVYRRPAVSHPTGGTGGVGGAPADKPPVTTTSVVAGAVILLACGVAYRRHRGRALVAASAIGAAIGAVAYPMRTGLVLGYRAAVAAIAADPGRSWRMELQELTTFYTMAPVADTIPRGMALGLLFGLAVGLLWPSRWCRLRQTPVTGKGASDA